MGRGNTQVLACIERKLKSLVKFDSMSFGYMPQPKKWLFDKVKPNFRGQKRPQQCQACHRFLGWANALSDIILTYYYGIVTLFKPV